MSNTLNFIQTYVATITENHNLREMEFKVRQAANIVLLDHIFIYINAIYIYCVFIGISVIYYFPHNSKILVSK